jgi:hypothetical protein
MMDSRLTKTHHSAAVRALLALWNIRRDEASLSNSGHAEPAFGLTDSSLPKEENGRQLGGRRLRQDARSGVSDPAGNNSKKGATSTLWFV